MSPPRVVFLWHLHQPEYRDPATGQPLLPWVRLHATRAYSDMAAALERHPRVKGVANWAPSLLLQLEACAAGATVDLDEQIAAKPVRDLTPAERAHVLRQCFSVDWELWVKPVPRYLELLNKRGLELKRVDLDAVQARFDEQELRDVQVHFLLAWMGFAARREEPFIADLIARERNYSEAEKLEVLAAQRRIAARVLPRWRALAERGQVEIACSPLYHPILPLLIDSDCARRAMPQAQLPPRFQHPEDAREQVRRGLDVAERIFGHRPVGMWPSEGSVSPEVVELLGECGVEWCATDQGILANSQVEGALPAQPHHAPVRAGKVSMLFRDRDLSDGVGFRYGRGEAAAGAGDLVARLSAGGPLVTLALDGENPWEHYPRSGEAFLDELYSRLEKPGAPESVLPRDELRQRPPAARIARLHSGSWIDANYRIWIGHAEDNAAWTLLGEARRALETFAGDREPALSALLVAEGSDWFWWYGDDFTTENAPEFDALFRRWVAAAWRHMKLPPPESLSRPIIPARKDKVHFAALVVQPRRLIQPVIDGHHLGYYEWAGAGLYRPPRQGVSMYRGEAPFAQLLWGFSRERFFFRLDPGGATELRGMVHVHLNARGREGTVSFRLEPGGAQAPATDERGRRCGLGQSGAIVEAALDLAALGLSPGDEIGFWVRVLRDDVEVDRLPRYGELTSAVPDQGFEPRNWQV